MLVTKEVKIVSNRYRREFEQELSLSIMLMEDKDDVLDVDVQFSTVKDEKNGVWFSAMVRGKGLPL